MQPITQRDGVVFNPKDPIEPRWNERTPKWMSSIEDDSINEVLATHQDSTYEDPAYSFRAFLIVLLAAKNFLL